MDRWNRAYTYLGFESLDHGWERFIVYGAAAAFWVNLAAWLITRDGIIPGVDGPLEWLALALLAVPGTAKAAFLIALGPSRRREWTPVWERPQSERSAPTLASSPVDAPATDETPATKRWWRLRMQVRREFTRRRRRPRGQARNTRPPAATLASSQPAGQVAPPPHPAPARPPAGVPAQARPGKGGSAAGTIVKILVVLALFAVCGGYWVTGGNLVDPSDTATEPPRLRNLAEKRHMLDLINEARSRAGVPPVAMGTNNVAQIQADNLLRDCVLSHWGTDGLKPYMRYSLAGGYQVNGENALTFNECNLNDTWLQWNEDPTTMVANAIEGWLDSPGHRETMLDPYYRKVNIGLAWDRNTFKAVQHFEGDFVELSRLPEVNEGVLTLAGRLEDGYDFDGEHPLFALIIYDLKPRTLTRQQLIRTDCYSHGEVIAVIIPPSPLLKDDHEYTETVETPYCPEPSWVSEWFPEPESREEMEAAWQARKRTSGITTETEVTYQILKARDLTVTSNEFDLSADVGELLNNSGPGVYTVVLFAALDGIWQEKDLNQVISEYSIFHEARAPGGYGR